MKFAKHLLKFPGILFYYQKPQRIIKNRKVQFGCALVPMVRGWNGPLG
jgi:hypothetical protein